MTRTAGAVTPVPTVADDGGVEEATIADGAPATPVAENSTDALPALARTVLAPAVVPSVHEVTVATPEPSDVVDDGLTAPPPESTENDTDAPPTRLPYWSSTTTLGAAATAVPTVALWLSAEFRDKLAGDPGMAVALNVTEPTVPADAEAPLAPATVPSVQEALAVPVLSVSAEAGESEPPPDVAENVTETPLTGLPYASNACTRTGLASAAPTDPVWPLPSTIANWDAGPAVAVAEKVTDVAMPSTDADTV